MDFLKTSRTRLELLGGTDRVDRIHKSKANTMKRALYASDQSAKLKKIEIIINENGEEEEKEIEFRGLVNPSKLTLDQDQKMLSAEEKYDIKIGDLIYWDDDNSTWLVILRHHEEAPYFRGEMFLCSNQVELADGTVITGACRPPVESTTPAITKDNVIVQQMNSTVHYYFSDQKGVKEQLDRSCLVKINGDCYSVVARNTLTNGIIGVTFKEHFNTSISDPEREEETTPPEGGITEGEPAEEQPTIKEPFIEGENEIPCYGSSVYEVKNLKDIGTWSVDNAKVKITPNGQQVKVVVATGKRGEFTLSYLADSGITVIKEIIFR